MEQRYMNVETGSVGARADWWYRTDDPEQPELNAVDRAELVPVRWDAIAGQWVEDVSDPYLTYTDH